VEADETVSGVGAILVKGSILNDETTSGSAIDGVSVLIAATGGELIGLEDSHGSAAT
jgi:hypothetical protein